MAEKAKRRIKKVETVREKAHKASKPLKKPRRFRKLTGTVVRPFKVLRVFRYIVPPYFRRAWGELRQVKWPGRKETTQLTLAVFIFALVFGVAIAVVDYGLDKVFRKVLLK